MSDLLIGIAGVIIGLPLIWDFIKNKIEESQKKKYNKQLFVDIIHLIEINTNYPIVQLSFLSIGRLNLFRKLGITCYENTNRNFFALWDEWGFEIAYNHRLDIIRFPNKIRKEPDFPKDGTKAKKYLREKMVFSLKSLALRKKFLKI